jgi:hypothetical protein
MRKPSKTLYTGVYSNKIGRRRRAGLENKLDKRTGTDDNTPEAIFVDIVK